MKNISHKPGIRIAAVSAHTLHDDYDFYVTNATLHTYMYYGTMRWQDQTIELRPGTVILLPPGQRTVYSFREPLNRHAFLHFSLDQDDVKAIDTIHVLQDQQFSQAIRELVTLYRIDSFHAEIKLWDMLMSILKERTGPDKESGDLSQMEEIQHTIYMNLQRPLSLKSLSESFHISRNHLNRRFKSFSGMTIGQFIIKARVDTAKDMLINTDRPIKAIAFSCGIPDQQYFNKLIRKHHGLSPTELRKTARD